jgi:hypothetical protein
MHISLYEIHTIYVKITRFLCINVLFDNFNNKNSYGALIKVVGLLILLSPAQFPSVTDLNQGNLDSTTGGFISPWLKSIIIVLKKPYKCFFFKFILNILSV